MPAYRRPPQSAAPDTIAPYHVHTKPRLADVALANLEHPGYGCYPAPIRIEPIRRRRAAIVTEAMFPRYPFLQPDSSKRGLSRSPIRSRPGVTKLVRFGAQVASADEARVDLLCQRQQATPPQAVFHSGDLVVIPDGPFAGIEAV